MYQNTNYSDKWFYAFITDMTYENNNTTRIYFNCDVWQTWQFDINFKPSFIEREMVNVSDDIPGNNLLPEGLEMGEITTGGTAEFDELEPVNIIAYSGKEIPVNIMGGVTTEFEQQGFTINGIVSSVAFIIAENGESYNSFLHALQNTGNCADFIVSTFTVPKLCVSSFMNHENKVGNFNVYAIHKNSHMQQPTIKSLLSTPTHLDNYSPRNQKLRTYPYLYLGYNPSNGGSKIFRYEDFKNGTPSFKIISEVNPNPSVYIIPQNYRGTSGDSLCDIVSFNGYPTTANRNDFYNSWLAQNSQIISLSMQQEEYNYKVGQYETGVNMASSIISGVTGNVNAGSSILSSTVNLAKADKNHDFYVKQQLAQIEKQQLIPDKVTLSRF